MKGWNFSRKTATLWSAILLVGLALSGCSAEFSDQKCDTAQDCFPGEICSSDGLCLPGDGVQDAGEDISSDDIISDDAIGNDVGNDVGDDVGNDTVTPSEIITVKVSPGTADVAKGRTVPLIATALDADGNEVSDALFDWESSDTAIATVSDDGQVTGVELGDATITVSSQSNPELTATSEISVITGSVARVAVEPATTDLEEFGELQLSATAYDDEDFELTDVTFTWTVDPDTSASIDSATGLVTANAYDSANNTVTVTANAEGTEGSATLTIVQGTVDSVEITNAANDQDFSVEEGATLELIATAFDNDGNALGERTATWTSSDEAAATVDTDGVVTGVAEGTTTITADIDGVQATQDVTVTTTDTNTAPVADAGDSPQNGQAGVVINLDATGSSDAEDDFSDLTFAWAFTENPNSDSLDDATSATPSFTPSDLGQYILEVTVTDTGGLSDTASVTYNIAPASGNADPVADAGSDVTIDMGTSTTLAGTATDAEDDNTSLDTAWTIAGPDTDIAQLSDATSLTAEFTPSVDGTFTLTLTVTDSDGATATDDVVITVDPVSGNTDPVAEAGPNQTVTVNTTVTLDGTGSTDVEDDASSTPLTYEWSSSGNPSGGVDTLDDPNSPTPSFTPTFVGTYGFDLEVTDSQGASSIDFVVITVTAVSTNTDPVANAGSDINGDAGTVVNLDGSGSTDVEDDASSTPLGYAWTFTTNPNGDSLSDANTATPSFTPSASGQYVVELTVTDSDGATDTDSVTINVAPASTNADPVADAGTDQNVQTGTVVTLDATGSTDAEDDLSDLTFAWAFTTDPSSGADSLDDATSSTPSFTPSVVGTYILELTVTDSDGATDTDTISVIVTPISTNAAPTANAGTDSTITFGDSVTLAGSGTDVEDDLAGTPLSYAWTIAGPDTDTNQLSDATSATAEFTPSVEGEFTLTLTVTDSDSATGTDDIVITVDPVAPAADCLIISEYVEGSSNNKALEIYNCGTSDIDLTDYHYCLEQNDNDISTDGCSQSYDLSGSLAADETLVLCNNQSDSGIINSCDIQTGTMAFNGDDRIVLFEDGGTPNGDYDSATDTIIDVFGELGNRNNAYSGQTYDRCDFTPWLGVGAFTVTNYYTELAEDTFSGLGVAPTAGCPAP